MNQQPTTQQTVSPIAPIDPQPIVQSESPTVTIILATAILLSIVIGSITGLVQVIMIGMLHQSKPSR